MTLAEAKHLFVEHPRGTHVLITTVREGVERVEAREVGPRAGSLVHLTGHLDPCAVRYARREA